MPQKAEKKDTHLRLTLDSEELYKSFQLIKRELGIRSNTDVLRFLIMEKAKEFQDK